ncbi:endonuclease Q family protein [Petroclostridium sp. X23]|uniref:endonuclease Q family protein n=1 Tax=Petroclostridium sp. X23 TaxID=3045146 RepID=UPI0024AD809F|nr:endonuclease Q family protein [Petroclostridium sp. X23]WHH59877.1 endonuclease Q family protein [Petroclostridium sp. X23]
MKNFFVDLHVHIGRSSKSDVIKRATANNLTFENIAYEAYHRKGIDIIGVVDAASPSIIKDIQNMLERGEIIEHPQGGMVYKENLSILLGAEIETREINRGHAHSLIFFPTLEQIVAFSNTMKGHIKTGKFVYNLTRLPAQELFNICESHGGVYIPAHVFSPHKSFYGNCCDSLLQIFTEETFEKIPAIELGLSADTAMASQLSELDGKTFTSNSDAHSLIKMGREYNIFQMKDNNYNEVMLALRNKNGRRVFANYGLDPKLGKYHRSFCINCNTVIDGVPPKLQCPVSPKHKIVRGVYDRIEQIKDRNKPKTADRPPYHCQLPLEFLPGIGPKTIDTLINALGTEMNILHDTKFEDLQKVVGEKHAHNIILAREGRLEIEHGGGGIYGKVMVVHGSQFTVHSNLPRT